MGPITPGGMLDHLFVDDRDELLESQTPSKRLPSYSTNGLELPSRTLTAKETRVLNSVGVPKLRRKKR